MLPQSLQYAALINVVLTSVIAACLPFKVQVKMFQRHEK